LLSACCCRVGHSCYQQTDLIAQIEAIVAQSDANDADEAFPKQLGLVPYLVTATFLLFAYL